MPGRRSRYARGMRNLTLLSLLVVALAGPVVSAEIHSWRDKDGNLHFGDAPPSQGAAGEVRVVELREGSDYANVEVPITTDSSLTLYSTSWCGYCKKAKRYFNANGIAYRELDIEKNAAAKRAYDRLRIPGVPVIVQDGRTMRGFSESKFERFYRAP